MDSAYSTKMIQLFTKGQHRRNISLFKTTEIMFHQVPSSGDITLNSNCIVLFKKHRNDTVIVYLARQIYLSNFPVFTWLTWRCVKIRTRIFSST